MKFDFKHIISLILGAFLVLIYWKGCNPCPEIGKQSVKTEIIYSKGKEVRVIDSTYYLKYYELLDQIPVEKPVFSDKVPKRIEKQIDNDTDNPCGKIRRFETAYKDSTSEFVIDGTITSLARGEIYSTDFRYTTKSLIIKDNHSRIDTININTNAESVIIKNRLLIGVETGISPIFPQASVGLVFVHKKNWGIGYRFEHRFNGIVPDSHNISVYKTLF